MPLSVASRSWRVAVVSALVAAYLTGTLVGQDTWWPFGPWRMFATSTAATGNVTVLALQVTTTAQPVWRDVDIRLGSVGLNRAELEGRQVEIAAEPSMLGTLAAAHATLRPVDPGWTGVRLVRRATEIDHGRTTGRVTDTTFAEWTVAGGGRVVSG